MYAIIEESGKQRKVVSGDEILIDLLEDGHAPVGKTITNSRVLILGGESAKIGQPYVSGASVTMEVTQPIVLGPKLHIQKFRDKKTWRKKTGHRQRYTMVRVGAIKG